MAGANGGMGRAIAIALAGQGIDTSLVTADEGIESAPMIQPEDISDTVLFILSMAATASPIEIAILPQRSPYV